MNPVTNAIRPPARPPATPRSRTGLRLSTWALALAALTGGSLAPAGHAAPVDPDARRVAVAAELTRARASLADLTAESQDAVVALRRTQAELAAARSRLAGLDARLARARARHAELVGALASARARESAGQARLEALTARIRAGTVRRDNLARLAYQGGASARLAVVVDVDSAQELAERLVLVDQVGADQAAALERLAAAETHARAAQAELLAARREAAQLTLRARAAQAEAARARAGGDAERARLSALAGRQRAEQARLAGRAALERRRLGTLEGESRELEAQLRERARRQARQAAAAAEARRAAAPARERARSSASAAPAGADRRSLRAAAEDREGRRGSAASPARTSPSSGVGWTAPTGAPVSSEFGMRMHPVLGYARLHAGRDYAAPCGAPIRAVAAGEIVSAGWSGGYGNRVVIAHAAGMSSVYGHLTSITVRGGTVARGQVIGSSGTTGLSTGCHLHLETRRDGVPVDPRAHL